MKKQAHTFSSTRIIRSNGGLASEAFEEAQRLNKPVLLSIGYAACHWCHVMAHESFENEEIAAAMNDLFVNIKVDREERPDVDTLYMTALQELGEQGGWPLTMFLTSDGMPFFGGTYFPPTPRYGRPGSSRWSSKSPACMRRKRKPSSKIQPFSKRG